jgi:hypothetical protein
MELIKYLKAREKFGLEQAMKAQTRSIGRDLLCLNIGAR